MKIKNVVGTAGLTCACDSWLEHHETFGGYLPKYCPVSGCLNKAEVGAHVVKVGSSDTETYIVPLCQEHNQSTDAFEVPDFYVTVSANPKITCQRV